MIFRQLFEPLSSTYTYLLGCEETGQARADRPGRQQDRARPRELQPAWASRLAYTLDTHIHADHITVGAAPEAARRQPHRVAGDRPLPCADVGIVEGLPLRRWAALSVPPAAYPRPHRRPFRVRPRTSACSPATRC